MAVSDADQEVVTSLVLRDVVATIGSGHERAVENFAANVRQVDLDLDRYIERLVEDVQQYFHDVFIDTTWPACPHHPNHPMWFRQGAWHADEKPVAKLGELGSLRKSTAG